MNKLFADEVRVGFNPQQYTVEEGVNNVEVCVVLDLILQRDGVAVQVTTSDSSATSKSPISHLLHQLQPNDPTGGEDYTSLNQTLVFNSGQQQMCVIIGILDDSFTEPQELFLVNLESLTGEEIFVSPAGVFIFDNDGGEFAVVGHWSC